MTASLVPTAYPAPGEVLDGKYQIERVLGEGGMGCVARAYHLLLRAPVALKFMNPQFITFPGAVERFINEGIASKKIRSDHVVPVDDVGKLPSGAPYLVMPCLEGMDLADLLARDGTPGLPIPRAVHFTLQILRGLQAAHANGIIHRDMKPSNCFVVKRDGEGDFVRILDFGISKVVQPGSASLTQTNSALGTPLYMSPEQARSPRDVDGRSDFYSVGVILYELLTGHTPFFSESGEFTEILFKLFTTDPPPIKGVLPDLPDELAAAVHKGLAREVDQRFATALEMAEALAPFADERSTTVLERMRAFAPEENVSLPPPAGMPLPPSLVAFSKLDARPSTDLMANRPTTDVVRGSPATEVLINHVAIPAAPAVPQVTALMDRPGGRVSAAPAAVGARARQDEAAARTQLGDMAASGSTPAPDVPAAAPIREPVPGAQTDLGASRDAAPAPSESKRSPLVFVAPVVALLAVAGVGFGIKSLGQRTIGADTTHSQTSASVAPPVTEKAAAVDTAPVAETPAVVTADASVETNATADAGAPATSASTKKPKTPGPQGRPGGPDALDPWKVHN